MNGADPALFRLHAGLRDLVRDIDDAHRGLPESDRYAAFRREQPAARIESAGRLLGSPHRVAFIGPYKSGQSTFINAFCRQPGLLPAMDRQCSSVVATLSSPGPGQSEHIKVVYYSAEEALRNILDSVPFHGLFRSKQGEWQALRSDFEPGRALEFLRMAAAAGASDEDPLPSVRLSDFLQAFKELGDRLGRTHLDRLSNARTYLTWPEDDRIGHQLLIRRVDLLRENDVLRDGALEIADTPGLDSLNRALQDVAMTWAREADAVVYLTGVKELLSCFEYSRESLQRLPAEVLGRTFVVANRADWLDFKALRRSPEERSQSEQTFDVISQALLDLGFPPERLHLTCGRFTELRDKMGLEPLTDAEQVAYEELCARLAHGLATIDSRTRPLPRRRLTACFLDGGVEALRGELLEFLRRSRRERLLADFRKVQACIDPILAPGELEEPLRPFLARHDELRKALAAASLESNA